VGTHVSRIEEHGQSESPAVDNSLEGRLSAAEPLPSRSADIVRSIILDGGIKPYAWSMDGEYRPRISPLMLNKGQRVEIEVVNYSMMAHPIHLHGHAFQVIAINVRKIDGAVRDTVLVTPMMGRVRIAFDADNPGRWAFHCHNLYHMQAGMMTNSMLEKLSRRSRAMWRPLRQPTSFRGRPKVRCRVRSLMRRRRSTPASHPMSPGRPTARSHDATSKTFSVGPGRRDSTCGSTESAPPGSSAASSIPRQSLCGSNESRTNQSARSALTSMAQNSLTSIQK